MTREEAIKKVRQMSLPKETMEILEALAPELKESEDERIRKALIEALTISKSIGELKFRLHEPTREECIAWLEKQKENPMPNSTELIEMWDKEEVKLKEKDFHGDEWRLAQNAFMDGFAIGTCVKFEKQKEQPTNEEMLRILRTEYEKGVADTIAKYEQKEPKPEHFELKAGKWYFCHHAFCCRADLLTVQEGERFMCEKDGVVKGFVIKEPEKYFIECSAPAPMEDEQKEQKPAEWGTFDKYMLTGLIHFLESQKTEESKTRDPSMQDVINWVNSLPERFNLQPKQEWSEKDEKMRERLITRLIWITYNTRTDGTSPNITFFDEIDWLKSLRPQPHWKPSEEQMEALAYAIQVLAPRAAKASEELENLREQLEKLI